MGDRLPFVHMEGREVFKVAVRTLSGLVTELLEQQQMQAEDIDFLIPHQANLRIIKATAEHLNLPLEKSSSPLPNTPIPPPLPIPLALDYGIKNGTIRRGHKLLLEAFGGGFVWGGSIITY